MDLQKITVKVFVELPDEIPLTDFIDVFHGWIQATDGVYHDVADYSHMRAGPGIVLVASHANLSIDEANNRRGLLYSQKAHLSGSNEEKIRAVLRAALKYCRHLEQEPTLRGRLKFSDEEICISINDRFRAPNSQETLTALKPDLEGAVRPLVGDANFTLEHNHDPRQRFSVTVRASKHFDMDKLAEASGAETQSS
jgi:hypothetical protein